MQSRKGRGGGRIWAESSFERVGAQLATRMQSQAWARRVTDGASCALRNLEQKQEM